MFHELRYALRTLRRTPGYTAAALTTLVLGIGANTAVFSIVQGVLLSPLPLPEPERLLRVTEVNSAGREMQVAWRNFVDWREAATQFDHLAAHLPPQDATVLGAGEALRVPVSRVSLDFFRAIGVDAQQGRTFAADEHRLNAAPAVVVSDRFWRTHLGEERDLAALRLTVGDFVAQVVGVAPPELARITAADLWLPAELVEQPESRTAHNYEVLGRLRPGAQLDAARAELDGITYRFSELPGGGRDESLISDYFPVAVALRPLHASLTADISRSLWILFGAALLVLLVACTNLASSGLARGTAREREYAVRHALGASRARLVATAFMEALTLAVIGAALGVTLAAGVIRVLPALAPAGIPRLGDIRLDAPVLAFTLLLSVFAAVAAGALPGLRSAASAVGSLRSGGRAGDGPNRRRIWRWLIGAELALALVLLTGAGLLLRSFRTVLSVEPGFHTTGVLTASLSPPPTGYPTLESRRLYYDAALEELRAVPGVAAVGIVASPPLERLGSGLLAIEHGAAAQITADYQLADAGYFEVMGIPLLAGRAFDGRDHEDAPHAVLVNRAFAAAAWPGEDPIGKRITGGGMDNFWNQRTWAHVIGVVGDIRQRDLTSAPEPAAYFSYRQRPFRSWTMTVALAPAGGIAPAALAADTRAALRALDADVPVAFATIDERVSATLAGRRFVMLIIAAFAGIALALASVGVYGVVSYSVERRRREIGIRLALGARPAEVRRHVQREYLRAGAVGALAGVGCALLLARLMTSLLFGVEAADPLTFVAVLATLGVTLWVASYVPALRSTRMDPLDTIRAE